MAGLCVEVGVGKGLPPPFHWGSLRASSGKIFILEFLKLKVDYN